MSSLRSLRVVTRCRRSACLAANCSNRSKSSPLTSGTVPMASRAAIAPCILSHKGRNELARSATRRRCCSWLASSESFSILPSKRDRSTRTARYLLNSSLTASSCASRDAFSSSSDTISPPQPAASKSSCLSVRSKRNTAPSETRSTPALRS